MRALFGFFLILLGTSVSFSSEFQSIDGTEAYELYGKLPGVACREYVINGYAVYTKYQTNDCRIEQADESKWNCTVQFAIKKDGKREMISANCTRTI